MKETVTQMPDQHKLLRGGHLFIFYWMEAKYHHIIDRNTIRMKNM